MLQGLLLVLQVFNLSGILSRRGEESLWGVTLGVSDADGWREEDKEASAAGADASLWLSGRSVPARMSVCCVSPTVPRQERSSNDRRGSAWTSRMW